MIDAPGHDGHPVTAHRALYRLRTGESPPVVRHACDVPWCLNPAHHIGGTQADNLRDMTERGRRRSAGLKGQDNPHANLTEARVRQIRELYETGRYSQREVALLMGTTRSAVCEVVIRRAWRHVP